MERRALIAVHFAHPAVNWPRGTGRQPEQAAAEIPIPGRLVSSPTDEALVERVAAGDQAAMADLYDRFQALTYGLAVRLTGDPATAQDVVQETFLGIWRTSSKFASDRATARTWILAICHHRAVDALRRRRPASDLPDPEVSAPAALVEPDVWPEVSRRLDAGTVRRAIDELPEAQREVIELAYFGGLTQHEIAARTDAPLGTVKGRARLALAGLRRALEPRTETGRPADVPAAGQSLAVGDR